MDPPQKDDEDSPIDDEEEAEEDDDESPSSPPFFHRPNKLVSVDYSESPLSALTHDSSMPPKKKGGATTGAAAAARSRLSGAAGPSTPVRRGGAASAAAAGAAGTRHSPRNASKQLPLSSKEKKSKGSKSTTEKKAAELKKAAALKETEEDKRLDNEDTLDSLVPMGQVEQSGGSGKRKADDNDEEDLLDLSGSSYEDEEEDDEGQHSLSLNTILEVGTPPPGVAAPNREDAGGDDDEAGSGGNDEEQVEVDEAEVEEVAEAMAQDEALVQDDHFARNQNEKEHVEFLGSPRGFKSPMWTKVSFLNVPKILETCSVQEEQAQGYEGIMKLREIHDAKLNKKKKGEADSNVVAVCLLCFEKPGESLLNSIVQIHTRQTSKGRQPAISNYKSHVERKAKLNDEEHEQFLQDCKKMTAGTSKPSDGSIGPLTVASPATAATGTPSVAHPYTSWAGLSRTQLINKMHELIYILVNDANIPAHVVRNNRLWDVIEFAANNGKQLTGASRSALQMGRYKFNSIQAISFGSMVTTIQRLVTDTKEWYARLTNRDVPFIYVGHDIWDGKNKSVLGLCLFIASPLLQELVILPVAMQRNKGKDSESQADQSLKALER